MYASSEDVPYAFSQGHRFFLGSGGTCIPGLGYEGLGQIRAHRPLLLVQ